MENIDAFLVIGIGSAVMLALMTFMMPVSHHRVNQNLISILIAILAFVAAFCLWDPPQAIIAAIIAIVVALLYRDIVRWVKEFMWHNVYRYTHRYYWYNRVGRAVLGDGRRGRRSRRGD